MNDDRIQIVAPVRSPVMFTDRFEFREERRFHWLQRLLLWGLAKLGCNSWGENLTVLTFRPGNVLEAIRRQRRAALEWGEYEPLELVIGADDFRDLMDTPEYRYSFTFDVGPKRDRPVFMGMRVRVVPWIKGAVIYPARA